jgi:tungstate transport system substrate-binding protein
MVTKHSRVLAFLCPLLLLMGCSGTPAEPKGKEVVLLTSPSFQESGLADFLIPAFTQRRGFPVKVIAVGTGAAFKQGAQGEGDVLLVHAPEQEKRWIAAGYGLSRNLVGRKI